MHLVNHSCSRSSTCILLCWRCKIHLHQSGRSCSSERERGMRGTGQQVPFGQQAAARRTTPASPSDNSDGTRVEDTSIGFEYISRAMTLFSVSMRVQCTVGLFRDNRMFKERRWRPAACLRLSTGGKPHGDRTTPACSYVGCALAGGS